MSRTRLSPHTAPPAQAARTLDALRAHYEVPPAFPPEALAEAEAAAGAWAVRVHEVPANRAAVRTASLWKEHQ